MGEWVYGGYVEVGVGCGCSMSDILSGWLVPYIFWLGSPLFSSLMKSEDDNCRINAFVIGMARDESKVRA